MKERGAWCTVWDMYDSIEKGVKNDDEEESTKVTSAKDSIQSANTSLIKTKTSVGTGTSK